ncbi:MAG: pyridoxamine 5'-phosphate oxidase family protein [Actinomycetota bacterium]|nr:pyridoxamine 5'-phosphate oxidase family protein [Actinomycetota bacterium]
MSDDLNPIRTIMESVRTCMLTTVSEDGSLHSTPMTTQQAQFDGDAWFLVGRTSHTAQHIEATPTVNVSYSGDTSWLSLAGSARVVTDDAKKAELWNTFAEAWFPDGEHDPDVVVLQVEAGSAQYWESPGKVKMLASMLKARVTGNTPDGGDSDKVEL